MAKALVLKSPGVLEFEDRPIPSEIPNGKCLVRIQAAALNHRDHWILEGKYAKIQYPAILGSDACGVVEKISSYEYDEFKNKEVIINPNLNWGSSEASQSTSYEVLGMPSHGTFSEYLLVDEDRIHIKPKHLSVSEAAALPLAGLTAYRAVLTQGKVSKGDKVLITGAGGGVAQMAIRFAIAAGAEVYVSSGKEENIKDAVQLGAKGGVNYKEAGWDQELLKMAGLFHVVIDSAGGDAFNQLIRLTEYGGRLVTYGATAGVPSKLNIHTLFWRQITIKGSTMGSNEDFKKMIDFVAAHKIIPAVGSLRPFKDILKSFADLKQGKIKGKMVVEIS